MSPDGRADGRDGSGGGRSRLGRATERAKATGARVRGRGSRAGRLRLNQLEVALVISVQAGVAAALAWWIGHDLLGNPSPIFAPSAAVGTIVAALGQRAHRTVELMLGVGLGIATTDLLISLLGTGFWQTGFVVACAICATLLLFGRGGAAVGQAGGTAVLLATLAPGQEDLEWPRIVEALVGGVVGIVVVALLVPLNPMRILDRDAAPVYQCLAAQLREVSAALTDHDQQRAVRALEALRGMGPDLSRMHEALSGAEEVVRLAPARWLRRQDVERFARASMHLERVIEHSRGVARRSAMALEYGEPIPPELSAGVGRLADAVDLLRREHRAGRATERTRQAAGDAVYQAGRARAQGVDEFGGAVVTQLHTAVSDLLRATGYDPTAANHEVRDQMRRGEEPS
ncbi:FUSC family protein [Micromonospora sp. WMMD1082]|uniref:FUSC family protein n=1 Tax=Micromonospora sp. WMMD1082 TaxID=3016104 RepID=UPI002417ABBE|nr:FUSC family protein [Micromonospora sp. WMMD1082]MDG4796615.1 FUSC family protein [Micromonospora sp. WMMD1082]